MESGHKLSKTDSIAFVLDGHRPAAASKINVSFEELYRKAATVEWKK